MSECFEPNCPVHQRVDESDLDEIMQEGSIITYVGKWAVFTGGNTSPDLAALKLLLELAKDPDMSDADLDTLFDKLPPYDRYETVVYEVGKEGVLGDLYEGKTDAQASAATKAASRFSSTHNSWDNFQQAHQMVVDSVRDGLISL